MRVVVDILETVDGDMRVDLGGGEACVAEQFLHIADVGTCVQKVRGEGVTEGMGCDFRGESGPHQPLLEVALDGTGCQASAVAEVAKDGALRVAFFEGGRG